MNYKIAEKFYPPFKIYFSINIFLFDYNTKLKNAKYFIKTFQDVLANQRFYLKNPFIISSSACFSDNPNVISFINCSPAIFPMAAS